MGFIFRKYPVRSRLQWTCVLFVLFLRAAALAQEAREVAQHKIVTNTNLVLLPVTVKDANGDPVPGLTAADFRVFEDGIEQNIDVFSAESTPLSIVVLVDDDLKPADAHESAPSLRSILAAISSADEAAICRFDLEIYPCQGFTSVSDRLLANLNDAQQASKERPPVLVPWRMSPSTHTRSPGEPIITPPGDPGSRPTKALDDAVYAAAELLNSRGRERRKLILIVSDGINGPEFNKHNYEETLRELLCTNASVFSVAVGASSFKKHFSRLRDYANESGGDIYYAREERIMERLCARITEEARHEYTLAYEPHGAARRADYHHITVAVARQGILARTREGYYEINGGAQLK